MITWVPEAVEAIRSPLLTDNTHWPIRTVVADSNTSSRR
jgi:hypothetical protein